MDNIESYHEASKHAPGRYAPGPGYLNWENQPEPFRWFHGAKVHDLPLRQSLPDPLFEAMGQVGGIASQPLTLEALSRLLMYSLGLAAWKEYEGVRWSLRCHPSSGNLHPIEGYVISPAVSSLPPGVHHYLSRDHVLETRWIPTAPDLWQRCFPAGTFLLALSLIHWRETWKYGLRSFRYCQLNLGHAAAALSYAASSLGWRVTLRTDMGDDAMIRLLGLQRPLAPEPEHPGLLLAISPAGDGADMTHENLASLVALAELGEFQGHPNSLGHLPAQPWPGVEEAARYCHKGPTPPVTMSRDQPIVPPLVPAPTRQTATELIRARRSAQRYDGKSVLSLDSFFRMLDRLLPRRDIPPWSLLLGEPLVHPVVLVHRVREMQPGVYLLARSTSAVPGLRESLDPSFLWRVPAHTPSHLPLFLLRPGDCRAEAFHISCQQEIAADGAFSLGMLADFSTGLAEGAWGYRALHWEAGILGQVLYLAAEAEGIRGTGIGCFFDDLFHQWMGLRNNTFQTVYHFTVGVAMADRRLSTLHPYGHIGNRQ